MKIQVKHVVALTLALAFLGGCAATENSRSTGQVIDDTTIAASIKSSLLADPATDGLNIDVEVDRSKVQLNGFVNSQSQVDRAGEIARTTSGVASVNNNLRTSAGDRSSGEYLDDNSLATRVKAALMNDPVAQSMKIDVEVNRGIVSLGGFVDSSAQRSAALAAARNVDGVENVIDNLAVR